MKLLIADDDPLMRHLLLRSLEGEYEITAADDGCQAWKALQFPEAARLLVVDWGMPGMDGAELCRQIRSREADGCRSYIILLTARDKLSDLLGGLNAGADDYIKKPFQLDELRARLRSGCRILALQDSLAARIAELEAAAAHVKRLRGLLPICSYCKRIRSDDNYWQQLEMYLSEHSDALFTHGICPRCYEEHIRPQLEASRKT